MNSSNTFITFSKNRNGYTNQPWLDKYLLSIGSDKKNTIEEMSADNDAPIVLCFFNDMLDEIIESYLNQMSKSEKTINAAKMSVFNKRQSFYEYLKEYIESNVPNKGIIIDLDYTELNNYKEYLLFGNTINCKKEYNIDYENNTYLFAYDAVNDIRSININSESDKTQFINIIYKSMLSLFKEMKNVFYIRFVFNSNDLISKTTMFYINLYNYIKNQ